MSTSSSHRAVISHPFVCSVNTPIHDTNRQRTDNLSHKLKAWSQASSAVRFGGGAPCLAPGAIWRHNMRRMTSRACARGVAADVGQAGIRQGCDGGGDELSPRDPVKRVILRKRHKHEGQPSNPPPTSRQQLSVARRAHSLPGRHPSSRVASAATASTANGIRSH